MAATHQGNTNSQAGSDPLVIDLTELFKVDAPEGKSVRDLVTESGLTEHQIRYKLRPMVERGEVEYAGTRQEQRIMDGKACQVPVYRMVGGEDDGQDS